MTDQTMIVLGIDPGFANSGYAVVRLHPDREELLALGVFCTKKATAKRHVLQAEDNFERARAISQWLRATMFSWQPQVIAFEAQSHMRNASSAAKVALAYGVLAGCMEGDQIPAVSPTPQAIKKSLTGRSSATKSEVERAVRERFGAEAASTFAELEKQIPKTRREHAFDAAAVILASLDSEVVRMGRRILR